MSITHHLQAIYDTHGELNEELVVEMARPKDHPLHHHFEWNNRVAGDQWRRHQAGELIRSCKVVYRGGDDVPKHVRAFPSVAAHTYVPVDEVLSNPVATEVVLNQMRREWKQMEARYGHFEEYRAMVAAAAVRRVA